MGVIVMIVIAAVLALVGFVIFLCLVTDPPKFRYFQKYEAAKRDWANMCSSQVKSKE